MEPVTFTNVISCSGAAIARGAPAADTARTRIANTDFETFISHLSFGDL